MSASRNVLPFLRGATAWEPIMKSISLGAFALVSALALASTRGHALSFEFSIPNMFGTTPGTVIGEIDGLQNNAISPATAVTIISAPSAFELTSPLSFPDLPHATVNSFTVTSGVVTEAFFSDSVLLSPVLLYTLSMDGRLPTGIDGSFSRPGTAVELAGFVTFSQVPGPVAGAGLPALITASGGLLLLGWLRRRRKIA